MPHVLPADAEKFQLYNTIDWKAALLVAYRRMRQFHNQLASPEDSVKSSPEKPRYTVLGVQTDNPSIFDHVDVKNMYITLNSTRYPATDYNLSFAKNQISRAYGDAASFRSEFYCMDELVSNPNIIHIALTSCISKTVERMVNERIVWYL